MSLAPSVLALVLVAALLHAVWNALVKSSHDPWLTSFLVFVTGSAACALLIPFVEPPARESWGLLALGAAIHNLYIVSLLFSYRVGDLSQIYPLARGSAPLIVVAASGSVAGEALSMSVAAGALLVSAGILSLAFEPGSAGPGLRRPVLYALVTGLCIAAYTLVDGLGIRRAGTALGFIVWLQAVEAIPFAAATLVLRRGEVASFVRRYGRNGALGGVLATLAYSLVLWAYSLGAIAPIAALRETGVIFAALIGTALLGEPFGRHRLVASMLVAAGVVVLNV